MRPKIGEGSDAANPKISLAFQERIYPLRINAGRGERGPLWQARFFDRALRSVKEYYEKVEYIHLDAVRAGFVKRAEEWQWSSVPDYTGGLSATFRPNRTLASDRVLLHCKLVKSCFFSKLFRPRAERRQFGGISGLYS